MGEIEQDLKSHFEPIYTPSLTSQEVINQCLQSMEARVTSDMNEELVKEITKEVHKALHQMSPLKSPSPDDFGIGFYQQIGAQWGRTYVQQQFWRFKIVWVYFNP